MKAVIQRVKKTSLHVDGELISEINFGLAVYFCVEKDDEESLLDYYKYKILNMRIFEDENGKMNKSILDVNGEILLISQFTLCADCSHGHRPSFFGAEKPDRANEMYLKFADMLRSENVIVKTGVFGADMKITQENDGPVTIIL